MQVFEFHFNPQNKDGLIFESFCFEPKNIYEKRMGSLYMAGSLKNPLPQNVRFLDNLAQTIKEKYYKTVSATPEKSLRETLRKTNEFLEKIAKAGDVSWLGNLNFAVIALKDFGLNFTKVGDLKIFLLRKRQIIDIDQKIKFEDIEPYPLKIFGNIVSGKLASDDVILILSKEVTTTFFQENILTNIANVLPFNPKKLKEILNAKKEQLTKVSGICLLIFLSKEAASKEKETLTEKKALKIFSFRKVFNPFIKAVKTFKIPKISFRLKNLQGKFKLSKPVLSIPKIPHISFLKIKPAIAAVSLPAIFFNKKITLILALIIFLAVGFFVFEKKEEKELKEYQGQINQIQEKINKADSYLIVADYNPQAKKNANTLLKEAWDEISPLVSLASIFPSAFANQVLNLKNTISENLYQLNKFVEISEPELVFEFKPKEFIPQKIISSRNNIYLFSPYSENVSRIDQENKSEILKINKKLSLAAILSDSVVFFSKPNQIINLKENQFSEPAYLETPYPDFDFNVLSSYRLNLYFLDNKKGLIIRYSYLNELLWEAPLSWLHPTIKNATDFKSMAVDGSVWLLTKNNAIKRYYAGRLQKTINLEIFPPAKILSKIFTSSQLPYLYLLEPVQKRIIILDKSGQIIRQYQSEKFDNLLDFAVSEDGKTIYLLNGLKVYKITTN